jgi:small basic protein
MIFVVALVGNMIINKSFGYIAQQYGVQRYTAVLLVLLCCSAVLLLLSVQQLAKVKSTENP